MRQADLGATRVRLYTDLHLRSDQPEEVADFAEHLDAAPDDEQAVVVMGDLFDAWIGPEHWEEAGFAPMVEAFRRLQHRGIRLLLLRGNRDVLLEPEDGEAVCAEVLDRVLVESAGRRVLITHGDEFCLRDRPYQRLRRALRSRVVRGTFRRLPLGVRRRMAARMRGVSRGAVARKPLDALSLVDDAVVAELRSLGAEMAVIGHLHVAEERPLGDGLLLRVLPAWTPGSSGTRL